MDVVRGLINGFCELGATVGLRLGVEDLGATVRAVDFVGFGVAFFDSSRAAISETVLPSTTGNSCAASLGAWKPFVPLLRAPAAAVSCSGPFSFSLSVRVALLRIFLISFALGSTSTKAVRTLARGLSAAAIPTEPAAFP